MKPCLRCEEPTDQQCFCGHAYCQQCRTKLRSLLCPMCVRVAEIRLEQAMLRRVVPWQYVDAGTSLLLSVGRSADPGAATIPVPKVVVEF